jgi:hypothetical protein
MKNDTAMITQSSILIRSGWSKSLLAKLLGEPDLHKKQFGRANLMCLYSLDRVQAAESSVLFLDAQELLTKRKIAAKKATETKVSKLMDAVSRMTVDVNCVRNVESRAIDAYNEWNDHEFNPASHKSERSFLDRICVNFIRHELTEYDVSLEAVAGKAGISFAVYAIREKVYAAIADSYPIFESECERQKKVRSESYSQ